MMTMIIFTPAIRKSAIGRMACLVIRVLISQGHKVTVVRTEAEHLFETPTHNFGTEVIQWNDIDQVINLASNADAVVYQIGDNYEFHKGCMEWLPKFPGLVCLHDFFLGHLFYSWAQNKRIEADAVLRNWYGNEISSRFFSYESSENFIEGTRDSAPMTEWVCSMAYAVITHSSWGLERVLKSCAGPVFVTPLAYNIIKNQNVTKSISDQDNNEFRLLTIGNINPNKRVASVIRAIGKSSLLRKSTVYRLVGYLSLIHI